MTWTFDEFEERTKQYIEKRDLHGCRSVALPVLFYSGMGQFVVSAHRHPALTQTPEAIVVLPSLTYTKLQLRDLQKDINALLPPEEPE